MSELSVYRKAHAAAEALSATLLRPHRCKDADLDRQMNRASASIVSNIAEGFEQKSDRHFAKYLYTARGSTREIRAQLQVAVSRARLPAGDAIQLAGRFEELARMLTGLIRHLEREDRKQRR